MIDIIARELGVVKSEVRKLSSSEYYSSIILKESKVIEGIEYKLQIYPILVGSLIKVEERQTSIS